MGWGAGGRGGGGRETGKRCKRLPGLAWEGSGLDTNTLPGHGSVMESGGRPSVATTPPCNGLATGSMLGVRWVAAVGFVGPQRLTHIRPPARAAPLPLPPPPPTIFLC